MSEKKSGLPGLRNIDHFGFTVPDLEEATRFLVDVLGCEYMYSLGPFRSDDEWMRDHLNVDPRAVMEKLSFFRMGGTAMLEVFQYSASDQREIQPKNSDFGGNHVAFYSRRRRGFPPLPGESQIKAMASGNIPRYFAISGSRTADRLFA